MDNEEGNNPGPERSSIKDPSPSADNVCTNDEKNHKLTGKRGNTLFASVHRTNFWKNRKDAAREQKEQIINYIKINTSSRGLKEGGKIIVWIDYKNI